MEVCITNGTGNSGGNELAGVWERHYEKTKKSKKNDGAVCMAHRMYTSK